MRAQILQCLLFCLCCSKGVLSVYFFPQQHRHDSISQVKHKMIPSKFRKEQQNVTIPLRWTQGIDLRFDKDFFIL